MDGCVPSRAPIVAIVVVWGPTLALVAADNPVDVDERDGDHIAPGDPSTACCPLVQNSAEYPFQHPRAHGLAGMVARREEETVASSTGSRHSDERNRSATFTSAQGPSHDGLTECAQEGA
jgi:hypothetical protein